MYLIIKPLSFCLLISFIVFGFTGKVVSVSDGDTYTILTADNNQIKIRLQGVDCPEKNQAFGSKAKQYASSLVYGKNVIVDIVSTDRYGRTVGIVKTPDGTNINYKLVESGFAWWYRQYAPQDSDLKKAEETARLNRVGLWVDPDPIPPWEFRKNGDNESSFSVTQENISQKEKTLSETVRFNTKTLKYHCVSCKHAINCTGNCEDINIYKAAKKGSPCKACGGSCMLMK